MAKSFSQNFLWMTIIRFFNIGTKFFLTAYLIRVLGNKVFGMITWADAILQYFIVFINFGFNIFGSKYISDFQEDKEKTNDLIRSVFFIKIILFSISFFIMLFFSQIEILKVNYQILLILLLSTIGDVLFPIWYFQGIEKIKPLCITVVISKLTLLIGCFFFVKNVDDTLLYVTIFTMSQILLGILGFFKMLKISNLSFKLPYKKDVGKIFNVAKYYLIGNFSMLIFNALTVFLIGVYSTLENVAGFDISLKIVMFTIIPIEILQVISLPKLSRTKNKFFLRKLILSSFLFGVLMFFLLQFTGEFLIVLLGGESMIKYTYLVKKLSYLVLFVPTGYIIGQCGLIAFNNYKSYNFSLIFTAGAYFSTICILFFFKELTFEQLINLRVYSDFFLFLLITYNAFKYKIFNIDLKKN